MGQPDSAVDPRAFRNALGQFATGVTIVTACGAQGERVGATVSSFNSVSLDPPMVLWSLDKRALSRSTFEASTHFAVHVLTLEQRELAQRFARRGTEKFEGLACGGGLGNAPLLTDCAACFECETRHRYDGGDHVIFVGEVKRFKHVTGEPLVFHGGTFAEARLLSSASIDAAVDETTGRFGPDFLCYLLTRAHFQTYRPLVAEFERVGITETEYFVLSMLCIRDGLSYTALCRLLEHTGHAPTRVDIGAMVARNLVIREPGENGAIHITDSGRRAYVVVLSADGRIASKALGGFSAREIAEFGGYLRRVIQNTNAGAPDVWTYSEHHSNPIG
jgi:3-hydroxy-9,10-secoandrosta-1,3,5(10)-triene-9,17-dione monooxygenase reductase component